MSYLDFTAGLKIFTGLRGKEQIENELLLDGGRRGASCEENGICYPFGQVIESGPKYRMGTAYVGYQGYQVGLNSQRISHVVQGETIHGKWNKQRAFSVYNQNVHGYFNYQSSNSFTLW